jgi:hypothetical protein
MAYEQVRRKNLGWAIILQGVCDNARSPTLSSPMVLLSVQLITSTWWPTSVWSGK